MTGSNGSLFRRKKEILDVILLGVLSVSAAIAVWQAYGLLIPAILDYSTFDYWFDGDPIPVYATMTERWSGWHYRNWHHPLFSLLTLPVYGFIEILHLSPENAVGIFIAAVAALWIGAFFVLLRAWGLAQTDATVFCILAAVSASAVFWLPTPETFSFGALSITAAIAVVALSERLGRLPWRLPLLTVISVLTLSTTTTNWMAGLGMLFAVLEWRKALKVAAATLLIVALAGGVEKIVFPFSGIFPSSLEFAFDWDSNYLFHPLAQGPSAIANVFFFHSVIMPEIKEPAGAWLSVQGSHPTAGGLLVGVSLVVWILLMILALSGIKQWRRSKAALVLVLTIAGQLLLHLVFGLETFNYALHFGPLLVAFAALSALTPARKVAVPLAMVLIVLAGYNNIQKFRGAADLVNQRYTDHRAFVTRVEELTEPEAMVVVGLGKSVGELAHRSAPAPKTRILPPRVLDTIPMPRRGWVLSSEHWAFATVEDLRQEGAEYFVSSAFHEFERNTTFFRRMEARYTELERTSLWVIYALQK